MIIWPPENVRVLGVFISGDYRIWDGYGKSLLLILPERPNM